MDARGSGRFFRIFLALLVVVEMAGSWALVARPAVGKARATDRSEALRVLFIGNSYTNFNMLPALVTRLAQSGNDVSAIQATAFTKPGYSLRMHWKRHRALRIIKTGHFSHIVLQSHSLDPIDRPEQLKQYVDRFVRAIEETGAQAVLYETWARHPRSSIYRNRPTLSSPDEMYRRIDEIFRIAAQRSRARLAPVGLAFRRMFDEHPDIDLHRADGSHPSWSGSFLAACVIYGVLTGNSPMTTSYHPFEVTPFQAGKLKQMAAQAIAQSANSDAFQSVF